MGFVWNYLRNTVALRLGRNPRHPLLVSYYVTHRCELNCRYCCDGDGKRFKEDRVSELSTDEAKRLIAIIAKASDTLDVTGGEPLLREDLEELLAYARALGLRTVLNTKGIGLRERPEIIRHTDVLVLGLDTLQQGALAKLIDRPETTAWRILDALAYALEARKNGRTAVVLSVVATPDTLADAAALLRFAEERGLGIHLSPEIVGTTPRRELRDNPEYRRLADEALAAKRRGAGVLGVPAYLRGIRDFSRFRCLPLLMPVVRPDGRMYYPCLESKRAEINLLECGSYVKALRLARRRYGTTPECADCCHIFCHQGLSLLQTYPWEALRENRCWRRVVGRA